MLQNYIDRFYTWALVKKKEIIWGFFVVYYLILFFLYVGGWSVYHSDSNSLFFHDLGKTLGKVTILLLTITLIPGIARRLGVKHKVISLIRIFRRYLGIAVFLFAIAHSSIVSLLPRLALLPEFPQFAMFELYGISAATILFFMFITSNDWSIARLTIWWYRLHRLIYVVIWFIFLHTSLQGFSFWSVLAGMVILVMVLSFVVDFVRNKKQIIHPM